jgi:hypothetical protein
MNLFNKPLTFFIVFIMFAAINIMAYAVNPHAVLEIAGWFCLGFLIYQALKKDK